MSFIEALQSVGPAADRTMDLYGWLVGDWIMDATVYGEDGSRHQGNGTIHAGWVLDGRAIQDVWILPGFFHGTTLRVYDPNQRAWHILWSDPVKQYFARQIGRARGADIVQQGRNDTGEATRWSFTEITKDSFCWSGEVSRDGGQNWRLQSRFLARRAPVATAVKPMLDHVSIGVRDLAASRAFYDAALSPLGYRCVYQDRASLGYGVTDAVFWLYAVDHPVAERADSGLHFSFTAPTQDSVDGFHAAALRAGARDNGRPGVRADYGPGYYAAFVIDPDGYRIEAHHDG